MKPAHGDIVRESEFISHTMANCWKPNQKTINSVITLSAIWAIVFFSIAPNQALAKSRRPISDNEIREKKNQCYADIESGLWGWQCKSSMIAKENCALQCLSPACYELVYEGDPLEEGEKDIFRSQEYKYCMHKLSLGESLDGVKGSFNY